MSAPDLTTVPARVPPDQVPEKVNVAGVNVVIQLPQSANKMDANKPVPERVPDEEVPERVNKVERIRELDDRGWTAAYHVEKLPAKLGVSNRIEAIVEAIRRGLVEV